MTLFKKSLITLVFSIMTVMGISQIPDYVDPGNVRGDESTVQLWENPSIYIPVVIVAVVVIGAVVYRSKKR